MCLSPICRTATEGRRAIASKISLSWQAVVAHLPQHLKKKKKSCEVLHWVLLPEGLIYELFVQLFCTEFDTVLQMQLVILYLIQFSSQNRLLSYSQTFWINVLLLPLLFSIMLLYLNWTPWNGPKLLFNSLLWVEWWHQISLHPVSTQRSVTMTLPAQTQLVFLSSAGDIATAAGDESAGYWRNFGGAVSAARDRRSKLRTVCHWAIFSNCFVAV